MGGECNIVVATVIVGWWEAKCVSYVLDLSFQSGWWTNDKPEPLLVN